MKLGTKLFWVVFASVVLSIFTLNSVLSLLGNLYDDGYSPNELQRIALAIQQEGASPAADVRVLLDAFASRHPGLLLEWMDETGLLIHSTEPGRAAYTAVELVERFANDPIDLIKRSHAYELTLGGSPGYLMLTALPGSVESQFVLVHFTDVGVFLVYVVAFALFVFAPAAVAVFFALSLNRRIKRLNRAMQTSDLHHIERLKDRSGDEIGQLARMFTEMSTRIHTQFRQISDVQQQRRKLVSNLSHNLRTPLTSIIGYTDSLNRGLERDLSERRQWISIILSRAQYMERLLHHLFVISLSENEAAVSRKSLADMCALTRDIVADYVPLLEERGLEGDISIPDAAHMVFIDSELIEQAIRNLLDNAITYGVQGGWIAVSLTTTEQVVRLSIADNGPGIPKEAQAHIFQRFYRTPDSKKTHPQGSGLGLAIVAEIAAEHMGAIHLDSADGGPTTFTLELPLRK